MNYAEIKNFDIANGPGVRVSLFVSGCTHHCKGCFNEIAWDFNYGKEFTSKTEELLLSYLENPAISGLTLLGGEPMEPENQKALLPFLRRVKETMPDKDIWLYTGYLLEQVALSPLLSYVDVIIDGPFMETEEDAGLAFRGSRNQRVMALRDSRCLGGLESE